MISEPIKYTIYMFTVNSQHRNRSVQREREIQFHLVLEFPSRSAEHWKHNVNHATIL